MRPNGKGEQWPITTGFSKKFFALCTLQTMTIAEDFASELKDAIKSRDRARSDVVRNVETEVARAKSEPGFSGEADDELYRTVISAYVKKMDKARQEYVAAGERGAEQANNCLLYTSPSPRDRTRSRMPSSA